MDSARLSEHCVDRVSRVIGRADLRSTDLLSELLKVHTYHFSTAVKVDLKSRTLLTPAPGNRLHLRKVRKGTVP